MNLKQLLEEKGGFFLESPKESQYYEAAHRDVIVHTARHLESEDIPQIDEVRPNESEETKRYRRKHFKQITRSGYSKFLTKCTRVIRQSKLTKSTLSDPLKAWLDTKPFRHVGESLSLDDFTFQVVLSKGLGSDSNAVLVAFPINPNDVKVPHAARS